MSCCAVRSNQAGDLGTKIGTQIIEAADAAEFDGQIADFDHAFFSAVRAVRSVTLVMIFRLRATTWPETPCGAVINACSNPTPNTMIAKLPSTWKSVSRPGTARNSRPAKSRPRPVERAADDGQCEQHDRFAGGEGAAVELSDAGGHHPTRHPGQETGDGESERSYRRRYSRPSPRRRFHCGGSVPRLGRAGPSDQDHCNESKEHDNQRIAEE